MAHYKFSWAMPHLCGMARRYKEHRLFVIFKSFFDECGTDPNRNKSLVVAGFIGHVTEWDRATEAWDNCMQAAPAISYFSHHEAAVLEGEFFRFNRAEAEEKTKNLATVIADFKLQGFCVDVPHSWFSNRDPKASKGMVATRAYDWGFLTATSGVLQWMERLRDREYTVDFVFDRRPELRACIDLFDQMKESGNVKTLACAGECIPGDDKKLAALQMADLLAGEFSFLNNNGPPPNAPFSIIAKARGVAHLPCTPPPQIPDTLAIHKLGNDIHIESQKVLKRIYKDKERSWELIEDVAELKKWEFFYWLEYKRLCESYGVPPIPFDQLKD